ncbi:anaerobic ribonucleoside-triphosphate reductase activating protein [Paenibacillus sp. CAU 1782]
MNLVGYYPESINEGPGVRAVLFISGCSHACPGCFSPHTWSFRAGVPLDLDKQAELLEDMGNNPLLQGVTLCGGDPFFSAEELAPFVAEIRSRFPHFDVWSYTGFTFEQLQDKDEMLGLLQLCDVIIDGRFMEEQKDLTLLYRGSSNQRILDVKTSLSQKKAVLAAEFISA